MQLSNTSGYSASLLPQRTKSDGTVVVAVPLYIDPTTGQSNSLNAQLTVSQGSLTSAPVSLSIQDIPALSTYGTNLGDISRAFYNYQAISLGRTLDSLQAMQGLPGNKVDTTAAQADVSQQLKNVIMARNDLDRVVTNNSISISGGVLPDGTPVSFNSSSLEMMDRVLGVYISVLQPSITAAAKHQPAKRRAEVIILPGSKHQPYPHPGSPFSAEGKHAKRQAAGQLPIAIFGTLSGAETIAGSVRDNISGDPTLADKLISVGGGLSAAVGIVANAVTLFGVAGAAPEVAAVAALAGVAFSIAAVVNHLYHVSTDYSQMETETDPATLLKLQNDFNASLINLPLDALAIGVSAYSAPAAGMQALGFSQEVVQALAESGSGTQGVTCAGVAFMVSTAQLIAQQFAINDQKAAQAAMSALQTPTSPNQGFGELSGNVNITNSQGPILSGLTGVSIDDLSGTDFSSVADTVGNYDVLLPLGDTTLNYSNMTIDAFDPVSGSSLTSLPIDLSGLLSGQVFTGPSLSGTCNDSDANNPDSDDPDCD